MITPDGSHILTGSLDKTARLWDTRTRTAIDRPVRHESRINDVAFSPDGKTMLTGSSDATARLWDVGTQKPIGVPLRHDGVVAGVAFRPDGKALAQLWKGPPAPIQGDVTVERIALWTQVITGQELDDDGAVGNLSPETWRERRQQLQALGGPPILRDEVSQ